MKIAAALFTVCLIALPGAAPAHDSPAPVQADVTLQMPGENGEARSTGVKLDGGNARVRMRVINQDDGRTAAVHLRFRYRIPPDTIALDEIVSQIEVETTDLEDNAIGRVDMDTNEVNLNPNGPRLAYGLTLYRPEGGYQVQLRVRGNYE
ncbi:MAG TPA: hypothetical protein VEC57_11020 [Candidatus Limnocylindrales bacterium]|nr:hypothetical protein [Candidatus Limnocylindrales bacterium]